MSGKEDEMLAAFDKAVLVLIKAITWCTVACVIALLGMLVAGAIAIFVFST